MNQQFKLENLLSTKNTTKVKKIKLSFIINVYSGNLDNLTKILENFPKIKLHYELIIVVDENSLKIKKRLNKIIKNLNNIDFKIFYQSKSGISKARNLGIDKATGCWITFLDGDDFIYANEIEAKYFKKKCDLIIFNNEISNNSKTEFYGFLGMIKKSKKEELIEKYLAYPRANSLVNHVWSKFYRLEFLKKNNIQFKLNLDVNEDFLFNAKVINLAKNLFITKKKLIFHYIADLKKTKKRHLSKSSNNYEIPIKILSKIINNKKKRKKFYYEAIKYWNEKIIYLKKL